MKKNINVVRGDTISLKFTLKTADGQDVNEQDIETLLITLKKGTDDISPTIFQKTLEDITFDDGYCHVVFEPEDTEDLEYGKYYFDIEVTLNNGYRKTALYTLTLTEETTLHRG